jgi:D-alanyl-D-alanine carboxypeptidase
MYLKKIISVIILLIVALGTVQAQTFNKAKMDSLLNAISAANKSMGSVAIMHNGQVVYQHAIGYSVFTDTQKKRATPQTKYRIGSISKMFTAVMIFQLIEEGKLTLNTPLADFYPQLPNASKITIGLMLQHRSGLHNFTNDAAFNQYLEQPKTQQEMLAIFAGNKPDFEPDSKGYYSNTNFVLLGYIVAHLCKKTYAEAVKERVVIKAGLSDTYYGGKITATNNEASSYTFNKTWLPYTETDMSIPGGAGAMVSTPVDLDKFITALFVGKLVSKESLTLMQTLKDDYGMGMFKTTIAGHAGFGHNGAIDAFGSQVTYFPADGLAIAHIHNADDGAANDIVSGAVNIYYNQAFKIPKYNAEAAEPDPLEKYTGLYAAEGAREKVTINKAGNTLIMQTAGQPAVSLQAVSPTVFGYAANDIVMEFEPGKNQILLKQAGRTTILTKVTLKTQPTTQDLDKYLGVYASPNFPLKIMVTKNDNTLITRATGQGAFPVDGIAPDVFQFATAGIILEFNPAKNEMTLKQGGRTTIFTKEK